MNSRYKTKLLALCSMMTALAIVLQWLGAVVQIGSYAAALFSGLLLVPVIDEGGLKYGTLCYFAISILSWILIPDKEVPVMYMLLCFTPLVDPLLKKKLKKGMCFWVELVIYIAVCVAVYPLIAKIFLMEDLAAEFQMTAAMVELGFIGTSCIIFVLFLSCYAVTVKRWTKYKQHQAQNRKI